MSETATGNQIPVGQTGQTGPAGSPNDSTVEASTGDVVATSAETFTEGQPAERTTAREVAAQHLARLLYAPVSTWSRYIFHENEPHPFGAPRKIQGRG